MLLKNYVLTLIVCILVGAFGIFGLAAALAILPTVTAGAISMACFAAGIYIASFIED